MKAKTAGMWVVVLWNPGTDTGSEQGRAPKWSDADAMRDQLKDTHPDARVSIDDARTWDLAKAA